MRSYMAGTCNAQTDIHITSITKILNAKILNVESLSINVIHSDDVISEQFTVKAHPALFGGEGESGEGVSQKKEALLP